VANISGTVGNGVTDVTPLVQVIVSRTRFDPATGRYHMTVVLRNRGTGPIRTPLALVLDHLPHRVKLHRPSGFTRALPPLGSPFRDLPLDRNVFLPRQVVRIELEFINPLRQPIRFDPRVLARDFVPDWEWGI
jgi:hypothetical protein